jgi:esterase/lipase superfamily enzyme
MGNHSEKLFKNIILAAPDFDARLFQEQIAPEVVKLSDNWTIYTSENDSALTYSGDINDTKRLGIPLPTIEGINVIDASTIDVTPWSVPEFHSYYATKQIVIRDLASILKGIPPSMRALSPQPSSPFLWLLKIPEAAVQVLQHRSEDLEWDSK